MKMTNLCFSALIAACAFGGLFAGTSNKANSKKVYVNKSDIEFCDAGIQVETSKGIVTTRAIHVDDRGPYFLKSEVIKVEEKGRAYRCVGCGREFSSRDEQRLHEWTCPYVKNHR